MKKYIVYISVFVILFIAGGIYIDRTKNEGNDISNLSMKKTELNNYGKAPEFVGIENWINSSPLTMEELRGKVVLVDFWTYSCINCVRTLPYVTGWYEKYKDDGLVIIGVHTPEFAFEKVTSNVEKALRQHNINYPVAQDNDYKTWNAYSNRYWPAHYLVDKEGNVVYTHFGEGKYEETEATIRTLLGLEGKVASDVKDKRNGDVFTPEIYFGLSRLDFLSSSQAPSRLPREFQFPENLPDNAFALEGTWSFSDESTTLIGERGSVRLNFHSKNVFMVAKSVGNSEIEVFVDGKLIKKMTIKDSNLYTLFEGEDSQQRIIELRINGSGLEAFTFTFG